MKKHVKNFCYVKNREYETKDDNYRFKFDAYGTWDYEPMVMYYPDGTGYPGCNELDDVSEIKLYDFEIWDPMIEDWGFFNPMPEQIKQFEGEVEEYLWENQDLFEFPDDNEYEEF